MSALSPASGPLVGLTSTSVTSISSLRSAASESKRANLRSGDAPPPCRPLSTGPWQSQHLPRTTEGCRGGFESRPRASRGGAPGGLPAVRGPRGPPLISSPCLFFAQSGSPGPRPWLLTSDPHSGPACGKARLARAPQATGGPESAGSAPSLGRHWPVIRHFRLHRRPGRFSTLLLKTFSAAPSNIFLKS